MASVSSNLSLYPFRIKNNCNAAYAVRLFTIKKRWFFDYDKYVRTFESLPPCCNHLSREPPNQRLQVTRHIAERLGDPVQLLDHGELGISRLADRSHRVGHPFTVL